MEALRDSTFDAACSEMHRRLVRWGLIYLKCAQGTTAGLYEFFESNSFQIKRQWTGAQIDAARALHSRVIRLPRPEQRIVLQVFYGTNVAEIWFDAAIVKKWKDIERELAPEINYRLRILARETGLPWVFQMRPHQLTAIRENAIRDLVRGESGCTAAATPNLDADQTTARAACAG